MKTIAYGAVAVAFMLVGCHTITEELPTQPTKNPASPILTVPIPSIPLPGTPAPTPTPKPSPGPTPTPAPTPTPPGGSGCGNPVPPPVTRMNTKIHIKGGGRYTLDTTPLVGPNVDYCRKIGFNDGRQFCPVRTEGSPDRSACEALAIGRAYDTDRPGPTWYRNGHLCTGESNDCENHEDNQYLLYAYGDGVYQACTEDDVCGQVQVDR